jgi:uncharacterized membrane protein
MGWHYLKGGDMVGCGGGSPCEQVLNSPWSTIAGILPISGLAIGVYLAMLAASFFIGKETEATIRCWAWKAMLVLAGAIAGSAIWFTVVQKWFIGDFCPYCMATHITGIILAAVVIRRSIAENGGRPVNSSGENTKMKPDQTECLISPKKSLKIVLPGVGLAALLVVFQLSFTPPSVYRDGKSQNNLAVFDFRNVPMIGSPDAPYVVTVLFDYQCPHCQKLHFSLDEVIRLYSGKVAFVLAPVPLNPHCNPYIPREAEAFKNSCELARIGLAVWVAKRDAFPVFESWMFSFESGSRWRPRTLEATTAKALELVGQANLDAAMKSSWIDQYLQSCVQIYGKTFLEGKGGVPKLVFGSRWVIPETYSSDDLIPILQNSLGIPKP